MLFKGLCTALAFATCAVDGALASSRPNLGSRARRSQERAKEITRANYERIAERAAGTAEASPAPRFLNKKTESKAPSFSKDAQG